MHRFQILLIAVCLISGCQSPEDKIIANANTIIKGLIDNPETYKYKDMEFMGESTYGASLKFWENYFRQNYVRVENSEFEKDIAAIKDRFKNKMDQSSVKKYKINYYETDDTGKIFNKSRVLYFGENQKQIKGMVYIYGMDAFEFDGLNEFKKYGAIE